MSDFGGRYKEFVNCCKNMERQLKAEGVSVAGCIPHIEAFNRGSDTCVDGSDATVTVSVAWGKVIQTIEVCDLVSKTFQGVACVSNPSMLKDWRGWRTEEERMLLCDKAFYKNAPCPRLAATVVKKARKKDAFILLRQLSRGTSLPVRIGVFCPEFLRKSVKIKSSDLRLVNTDIKPEFIHARSVKQGETLYGKSCIGVVEISDPNFFSDSGAHTVEIPLGYYCLEGRGDLVDCTFMVSVPFTEQDALQFVLAYEEVSRGTAKGNIPMASDGKYYNVWWKKNAPTTLEIRGKDLYEKEGSPMRVEFCVPKCLPSFVPKERVRRGEGRGYIYYPADDDNPHIASWYRGVWIEHSKGRFQYIDMDTPSAESYMCYSERSDGGSMIKMSLKQLIGCWSKICRKEMEMKG